MRLIKRLGKKTKFGGTGTGWTQPASWLAPSFNGLSGDKEWLENSFEGYVQQIYKDNGVAFACVQTRALIFSEARFQFQRMRQGMPAKASPELGEGDKKPAANSSPFSKADDPKKPKRPADANKPGEGRKPKPKSGNSAAAMSLFGTEALKILDEPWPGGTTGELLFEMDVDASVAGNSYWTYTNDKGQYGNKARYSDTARITRLRPDFVQIIIHSRSRNPWAIDAKLGGYLYKPFGNSSSATKEQSVILMPDEVGHYAPIQDPIAHFRGMSWLTPVLRELGADISAMNHKKKFFDKGATLGHVVSLSEEVGQEDFEYFVEKFKEEHGGVDNAYKTLVLGGGADVSTVGVDLKQLDFSQTQGHGETRIAAASGVPPVIVGLSEGLQAATYANYAQARRRFADGTLRPLWRMACSALAILVEVPDDARLWFDDRDISFLRDDQKDEAEIAETDARGAKALIEAGYEPDAVTEWLMTRDPAVLMGNHSGLVSVQLLPPGTPQPIMPGGGPGAPGAPGGAGGQQKPAAQGGKPASASSTSKPKPKPSASKPAQGRKRYVRD